MRIGVRTQEGLFDARQATPFRMRKTAATQLAPVSREMILCFIAERELGLSKSY
jgi:acyl-CoA dehydrogenase